jgi:hypothetical protein
MTRKLFFGAVAIGLAALLTVPIGAQLTPYAQDFESLDQASPGALGDDGWLIFGNVWGPDWNYWYGYGAFPAPNGTPGFSSVAFGQGGLEQGQQQLVAYTDYDNGNQWDGTGAHIEANVFQEQPISAADVGTTWSVEFDAKRGDLAGGTTASAFFKTIQIDPCCSLTGLVPMDLTSIPATWDSYSLSIAIDPSLEGQLLQFGFASITSNGESSGMLYDNIAFDQEPLKVNLDVRPRSCPNPINAKSNGLLPVAVLGTAEFDVNDIDVSSLRLAGAAPYLSDYGDAAAPFGGEEVCGCSAADVDGHTDLMLKFVTKEVAAGVVASQSGDQTATLTGSLLDGTPIEGQDCLIFVGGPRPLFVIPEGGGFGVLGESSGSGTKALRDPSWKSDRSRTRER